ncbi:MAG: hypothetical protein A3J99_05575 [Sideroxydans sp. RIFOXYD2_FULL_59_7]|nr:MAG: hypothetical protein A3J99_05575 [Sideroxydans sp. RIFOXYD2_FULL_59_7]
MVADYTRRHVCLFLINHQKIHVIPAKAGIQMINNFPRKWGNNMVLSALRPILYCWIPAFAGMTA